MTSRYKPSVMSGRAFKALKHIDVAGERLGVKGMSNLFLERAEPNLRLHVARMAKNLRRLTRQG